MELVGVYDSKEKAIEATRKRILVEWAKRADDGDEEHMLKKIDESRSSDGLEFNPDICGDDCDWKFTIEAWYVN